MPTRFRDDDTPVVEFDPRLELSPFTLFRRLRDGRAPRLIDVRERPSGVTLVGAETMPGRDWRPAADAEILLFDDDGTEAVELAERLRRDSGARVLALFGGLQLYRFALPPEVVGRQTYLIPVAETDE